MAAAWAANTVAMEREKDTWITLISAPLEAREIVLGKLAGSFYAARLVLPPLMLVWALAAAAEPAFVPAIVFTLLGLGAAAFMLCMLGLFFSFWCANATRALGATLGTIFAATILGSCCIFPLGIFNPLYLLLLPGVITLIALESSSAAALPMSIAGIFYGGTWLVALAVHLGCGGILWAVCVSRFDHFAGRISAQGPSALSIPTPQERVQ